MTGGATERLHQREVRRNMGETEPAIHVAAHEGRILLGGAPDKLSNLVAVATKAALMDVGIAWLMELIVEWVGSGRNSRFST